MNNTINNEDMLQINERPKISENELIKIMREIEKKTENKVMLGYIKGNLINPLKKDLNQEKIDEDKKQTNLNLLKQIMQEGSDEFQERTGRTMSYSEMRMMFG